MHRSARRTGPVLALLGALAAVAAGCGGASGTKTDGGQAGRVPGGPPIELMTIYAKSGPVALPEIPEGALAAVRAINAAGGVKGRPLHLTVCSDGGNPNGAADCAREAVRRHVVATVGNGSTLADVYMPLTAKRQIPAIGNVPSGGADFTSPNSFPIMGGPTTTFAALPRFVADQGAKRIVFVRPDLPAAAAGPLLANRGLAPLRRTLSGQIAVPPTAPDMTTYAAQALATKPDGVVIILPTAQAIAFAQAIRQQAPDVAIGLASTDPAPVYKALGADAAGIVQALDTLPTPGVATSTGAQFVAQMRAAGYGELSGYRLNSWLAVRVFADVARRLPDVTAPALLAALSRTSGLRTGLTPPLQFVHGMAGGTPRSFSGCALAVTIAADGTQKPVTGRFFDAFADAACSAP